MKYMKLSQAIEKLQRIKDKYGDLDFVENSSNPCGYVPFNFYLREVNSISNDGLHRETKIVVSTVNDGLEFNPELGDEDESQKV